MFAVTELQQEKRRGERERERERERAPGVRKSCFGRRKGPKIAPPQAFAGRACSCANVESGQTQSEARLLLHYNNNNKRKEQNNEFAHKLSGVSLPERERERERERGEWQADRAARHANWRHRWRFVFAPLCARARLARQTRASLQLSRHNWAPKARRLELLGTSFAHHRASSARAAPARLNETLCGRVVGVELLLLLLFVLQILIPPRDGARPFVSDSYVM